MPTIRRKQPPRSRHCERSHLSAEAFGEGGSNPESFHGGILDCFVASAQNCFAILSRPPRHDGARGGIAILQHAAQIADTPSQPRGLNHPSFASSFTLFNQRGCREDRVLTSHPRSAAQNAHAENRTAAYRWCRSLGLPCAMVGRLMPCSPGSRTFLLASLASRIWMMLSARLGSHTPPRKLDRSNDGQDHTVLPYARPAISPQYSPAPSTKPETYERDEA